MEGVCRSCVAVAVGCRLLRVGNCERHKVSPKSCQASFSAALILRKQFGRGLGTFHVRVSRGRVDRAATDFGF